MRALFSVVLALVSASSLLGCGRCPNRTESSRVLRDLDALIAAPNDAKAAPLQALKEAPCSAPAICDARDRCVFAFGHMVEGMRIEKQVQEGIARIEREGGSKEAVDALEAELDRAERELEAAQAAIPECERAASDLRRICG